MDIVIAAIVVWWPTYARLVRALKKQLQGGFERVDPHP
mgnify:CR=1 FL=1